MKEYVTERKELRAGDSGTDGRGEDAVREGRC